MVTDDPKNSWQTNASLDVLRLRASVFESIREFFKQREVLEVDTPVLSAATTPDPNIQSFETRYVSVAGESPLERKYLSTSPEFHMKRMLASGSGSIYQLCHVFRQSEFGKQHNPEFTLLEWYRVGFEYQMLMQEVAELVEMFVQRSVDTETISYQAAFLRYLDIDPLSASLNELQRCATDFGLAGTEQNANDKDFYLDFLMSHQVQPQLEKNKFTFIIEYPASQCALARLSPDNNKVAERFELYFQGVELANGYHELTDAKEQQKRFEQQNQKRLQDGIEPVQWDQLLVQALQAGMPACSGVALGVDRLIQLILEAKNLGDVLAFPFNHA